MSYQSPIEMFTTDPFIETLKDEADELIVRAVANAHVEVDRKELIKALQYDRDQYVKGYTDGVLAERNKPTLTNADRIRAMSDEEFARFIRMTARDAIRGGIVRLRSEADWLDWLKQEAIDD